MDVQCKVCGKVVDLPITEEQLTAWQGGQLIQHAMPHLDPGQRELLISGICGECFDRIFGR